MSMLADATVDTDISARSFWAKPFEEREKTFAWLRANRPVSWHRPYESTLVPPDENTPGFWALTKYDDMQWVSRTPELFSSASGSGPLMEDLPALTTFAEEAERIQDVALAVADLRRDQAAEDLVSWVVHAEWEGERMDDWEIAAFFVLLGSAANDTTRHSLAHGVHLFDENPDQRVLLLEDLDGRVANACEEVLRHCTPVRHFRRTATQDIEIRGTDIKAGDKVVMWYCSGNRDEDTFPDSARFDIQRPNARHHMAFGAGGPHFCIGATLARHMMKTGFRELYTRMPDIGLAGDPVYQVNNFMHGVHAMPVRWSPHR